jgi:F-type H+-transporting ATPase subunit gamma
LAPGAQVAGDRYASVKALRLRLASIKSIQRITKTMKMVAAAKLKGFQARMFQARPLGDSMNNMVAEIPPPPEGEEKDLKYMIVPITSDRGLCGGVNSAISKAVKAMVPTVPDDSEIFVIGNKGDQLLKRVHGDKIVRVVSECYKAPTSFALASEICEEILSLKYDKAAIFYNKFQSAIAYETTCEEIESSDLMLERIATFTEKYEFEDEFTEQSAMADMMAFCLASKVYSRLLEGATSEVSARMQAMENATKNCGEMIDKLTINMNKARQALITQELGEIVSGAAAVGG